MPRKPGPGDARFWIAGLGDQLAHRVGRGRSRGEDDLLGTLARVTTDHPVILLAHEPDIFVKVPARVPDAGRKRPWRPNSFDMAEFRPVPLRCTVPRAGQIGLRDAGEDRTAP